MSHLIKIKESHSLRTFPAIHQVKFHQSKGKNYQFNLPGFNILSHRKAVVTLSLLVFIYMKENNKWVIQTHGHNLGSIVFV